MSEAAPLIFCQQKVFGFWWQHWPTLLTSNSENPVKDLVSVHSGLMMALVGSDGFVFFSFVQSPLRHLWVWFRTYWPINIVWLIAWCRLLVVVSNGTTTVVTLGNKVTSKCVLVMPCVWQLSLLISTGSEEWDSSESLTPIKGSSLAGHVRFLAVQKFDWLNSVDIKDSDMLTNRKGVGTNKNKHNDTWQY